MIELYDRNLLLQRRDHTLWMAGGLLVLGCALMGLRGWSLQQHGDTLRQDSARLQSQGERMASASTAARQAPTPALLAELKRMADNLETEVAPPGGGSAGLRPSQWLAHLATLSNGDVGIVKAEIARSGAATLEGQARSSAAITDYMQAWEQHPDMKRLAARGLDIREETDDPGLLRFTLRTAPPPGSAAPARPEGSP